MAKTHSRPPTVRVPRNDVETDAIRDALRTAGTNFMRSTKRQSPRSTAARDRLVDSAGDDQADTGTKPFEREQEISLVQRDSRPDRPGRAGLERLDAGRYGWCERCGNQIPVERLAAFPSATLCITCKQLEERR